MTKQFSACAESQPAWLKHRASRHRQQPLEDRGTGMRTDIFRRITDKVGCAAPLTLLTIAFKSIIDNRYQNADKKQSANHSKEETFHLNAGGDESSISFASAKQIITTTKQILQEFKNTEWGTADNDQIKELEVRLSSLNEDMQISISTSDIDTVAQDQCRVIFQSNSCTEILLAPRSSLELLNYICTDSQRILFVKSRQHAAVLNRIK